MVKKLDSNILFLSGVIVVCFSVLIYHINPYYTVDKDFWTQMNFYFSSLFWKPIPMIGLIVGSVMIFKVLKLLFR